MDERVEAARWFAARRRGMMALEECSAYDHWLADDTNYAALCDMERLWTVLDQVSATESGMVPSMLAPARMSRKFMFAVASIVAFGIGILSVIGPSAFWTSLDWVNR